MAKSIDRNLHDFILQLGDNSLIIGHRLSEWCGHGPALEQDIALANIALDHVGQARLYYQLAASMEEGKTEDDYAYLRNVTDYKNLLILEHENIDFAYTIARSFYYDHFHILLLEELTQCSFLPLKEIAAQAIKEVKYHCRYSQDWILRLGDGTEESHRKITQALADLFPYTGEFFIPSAADTHFGIEHNVKVDTLHSAWKDNVSEILQEATLSLPEDKFSQKGGKIGRHTEKFGFLLAEMQYMQRAFPNATW